MTILDEPSAPHRSRRPLAIVGGLLLVIAVAAIWLWPNRTAPPRSFTPTPAAAPAATPPPIVEAPRASTTPAPAPVARSGRMKTPAPPPAAEPATSSLTLKVDSDVAGADVFVDRVYLGKTPLETHDVKAGSHTLNASAEGYESQALPIEVNDGANDVMVRFKIVRLDEAITVVHKHAIGSCEGRLLADPHGLRYESSNKEHSFDMPFSQIKSFEVDYLQKNLRLTRRDGKTFNFTDRAANADGLFVFHKKVQAARARLSQGDTGSQAR